MWGHKIFQWYAQTFISESSRWSIQFGVRKHVILSHLVIDCPIYHQSNSIRKIGLVRLCAVRYKWFTKECTKNLWEKKYSSLKLYLLSLMDISNQLISVSAIAKKNINIDIVRAYNRWIKRMNISNQHWNIVQNFNRNNLSKPPLYSVSIKPVQHKSRGSNFP